MLFLVNKVRSKQAFLSGEDGEEKMDTDKNESTAPSQQLVLVIPLYNTSSDFIGLLPEQKVSSDI